MTQVLVINGHPQPEQSTANRRIITRLNELAVGQSAYALKLRTLSELYADKPIDVKAEQEALLWADAVVLQFPFYWYALPGQLKVWFDLVFAHGFAYGSQAVLGGRHLIYSFTTGAPESEYAADRGMHHSVQEFIYSFEQSAALCRLTFHEVHTCGMMYVPGVSSADDLARVQEQADSHAARLHALLMSLK